MWKAFENMSGLLEAETETRWNYFCLSISKETLRVVQHLPLEKEWKEDLDEVLEALEQHINGTMKYMNEENFGRGHSMKRRALDHI